MKAQQIILEPIMTEKSYAGIPNKVYTFKVAKSANKIEIKKAGRVERPALGVWGISFYMMGSFTHEIT